MNAHIAQRQGDEIYCPRCEKRWGMDEDPPICITSAQPIKFPQSTKIKPVMGRMK